MNFKYLEAFPKLKKLYTYCNDADELVLSKPRISVTSARSASEYIVKLIYASAVGDSTGMTAFDMLSDPAFKDFINDPTLLRTMHYIRKIGNVAVHEGNITKEEALNVLEQLHFLVGEFCIMLKLVEDYPEFVAPTESKPVAPSEPAAKPEDKPEKVVVSDEVIAEFAPRMRNTKFDVKHKRDEEENKKLYMRACLREAGWPIVNHQNQALPSSAGINMILDDGGSVDYVLYGKDNRPLAIIEYTETSKDLVAGRMKAIKVANDMSVKYGYKPIAYYTNGYYIFVIDQLGYEPRRVFQFHSIEELELLKARATTRQDISNPSIDDNITNRDYQKDAIRAACNAFNNKRRHSLLVMATGTGKTRVSISIVDILMKNNWAKNVLFLADRTSLVRQAHKNFNKLLPSVTTSMYTGASINKDPNARIIFSTYQTMINLINDDTREFSVGRFDLIVVDEAHRSIFKKYGALFDYFDALMLGLTATPRSENNKNTYERFDLPDGKPDYAYELEQAVADGFLVGFHVEDKTTKAMRRGIRYDDLTDEQKDLFEDAFAAGDLDVTDYTGTVILAKYIRDGRVINLGTIDAMLNDLMKNGIKIENGDKLGKTIIFAANHAEAEQIVNRFNNLYPHLGWDFCKLIDSHVANSLNLIDLFEDREKFPQIAVSVDMLDTGVDVPDILNLVFFKNVKSKIKFLQMIGRGTRLSPDVFGPTMDKTGFLIFDYYDNFNYFSTRNTWGGEGKSWAEKIFNQTPQGILINKTRLSILANLIESDSLTSFDVNYKQELKDYFIGAVQSLNNDDLSVQYNMSYVSKYRTPEMWDSFSKDKMKEIEEKILPLIPPEKDVPRVKSFDLMMYAIEAEVPKRISENKDIRKIKHGFGNVGNKIDEMVLELLKLKTIPAVVQKEELLNKMRHADYVFEYFSYETCEKVRKELRGLMQYIPDKPSYYIIDAADTIIDGNTSTEGLNKKSYRDKVKEYIQKGNAKLAKIRNLDELTDAEKSELEDDFKRKMGTESDFLSISNNMPLLVYLRLQVGIADEAINTKFGSFLNNQVLTDTQLTYMNQIINYVKQNGDITFLDLQSVSPFCDIDIVKLFGTNIKYIKDLINGLHKPIM